MAKDKGESDDLDLEDDTATGADNVPADDDLGGDDLDLGGGDDAGNDSALIQRLAGALQSKGLVIPNHDEKDLRTFAEHLITSLATSDAHDGGAGTDDTTSGGDMAGTGAAAGGAAAGGTPTPEQNQFTMMSNRRAEAQDRRILELESELAKGRMQTVLADIDLAERAGLVSEPEAKTWRAKLKAKSLSLVRPGDTEIRTITAVAKKLAATARQMAAKGLLEGKIDLSRAQAVTGAPDWSAPSQDADPEKVKQMRAKLTTPGPAKG